MKFCDLFSDSHRLVYDNGYDGGIVIEYETEPPHFREALTDGISMTQDCGSCKFCGNMRSERPLCTKYGVHYQGIGCLSKTVCDDFQSSFFDLFKG